MARRGSGGVRLQGGPGLHRSRLSRAGHRPGRSQPGPGALWRGPAGAAAAARRSRAGSVGRDRRRGRDGPVRRPAGHRRLRLDGPGGDPAQNAARAGPRRLGGVPNRRRDRPRSAHVRPGCTPGGGDLEQGRVGATLGRGDRRPAGDRAARARRPAARRRDRGPVAAPRAGHRGRAAGVRRHRTSAGRAGRRPPGPHRPACPRPHRSPAGHHPLVPVRHPLFPPLPRDCRAATTTRRRASSQLDSFARAPARGGGGGRPCLHVPVRRNRRVAPGRRLRAGRVRPAVRSSAAAAHRRALSGRRISRGACRRAERQRRAAGRHRRRGRRRVADGRRVRRTALSLYGRRRAADGRRDPGPGDHDGPADAGLSGRRGRARLAARAGRHQGQRPRVPPDRRHRPRPGAGRLATESADFRRIGAPRGRDRRPPTCTPRTCTCTGPDTRSSRPGSPRPSTPSRTRTGGGGRLPSSRCRPNPISIITATPSWPTGWSIWP